MQQVGSLKQLAAEQGGEVTLHEFCRRCGYGPATVYRHFGTWSKLRRAAGLAPRFRMPRTYSDDELLRELVRLVRLLGKFPTHDQIDKLSRYSVSTYLKRFGNKRALRATFSDWLQAQPTHHPPHAPAGNHPADPGNSGSDVPGGVLLPPDRSAEIPPHDRWLLHLWQGVRLTFLPRSSDLQHYDADWPELLIVDLHDWPAAPCPVLQITDLMSRRIKDLTTKSKPGPKPRASPAPP